MTHNISIDLNRPSSTHSSTFLSFSRYLSQKGSKLKKKIFSKNSSVCTSLPNIIKQKQKRRLFNKSASLQNIDRFNIDSSDEETVSIITKQSVSEIQNSNFVINFLNKNTNKDIKQKTPFILIPTNINIDDSGEFIVILNNYNQYLKQLIFF